MKIFRKISLIFLALFILSLCQVLLYKWVNPPITSLRIIRYFQGVETVKAPREWAELEDISKNFKRVLLASEDQKFFEHHGFDLESLEKAFKHNKNSSRKVGGSTLSQQTAKNIFLWPQRSYIRKAFEAYYTFWIELIWGKERILEVYLNSIEMGKGVYGIHQAAHHFYKRDPKKLSLNQSAAIVCTLPNPLKRTPALSAARYSRKYNRIIRESRFISLP